MLINAFYFQYIGKTTYGGVDCQKWQYVEFIGHKKNSYTMHLTMDNNPVHYEMMGYDTLLGSHYDKYEMKYADFSGTAPSEDIFNIPEGKHGLREYCITVSLYCLLDKDLSSGYSYSITIHTTGSILIESMFYNY